MSSLFPAFCSGAALCSGPHTSERVVGHSGSPLPNVGKIELIVDGHGEPLCITELMEVAIKPFNAVDEQFAFEYGEGDRTLAFWLRDNWEFLARECVAIGRTPSETMPIVFQRFRVLYP